jgi:hypothetical protein
MTFAVLRRFKSPMAKLVVAVVPLFAALSLHVGSVALPTELDRADDPISAGFRVTSPRNPAAAQLAVTPSGDPEELLTSWTFTGKGVMPSPWQGGGTATTTKYTGPTSATHGNAVALSCSVTGGNSQPPGLQVTFYVNGTAIGTAELNDNHGQPSTASIQYTFPVPGTYTVFVKYNGDFNDAPSTSSTVTVTVN